MTRTRGPLDAPATVPLQRIGRWLSEARRTGAPLPEAMALATVGRRGRPSVRFVLLKQLDQWGLVFYTDRRSRKGRELTRNPYATAALYWDCIGKQVRIEGRVEPIAPAQADTYWASRPRPSQVAASVSVQSAPLSSRLLLLGAASRLSHKLEGKTLQRPEYWTGLRLRPSVIEFWIRGPHRLHRRELFIRSRRSWRKVLLQP